ncbi:MAG: histidine kinase [Flavobacteriales bacterium]|nr:histidine kinase [Flavobacteriales bacterium]
MLHPFTDNKSYFRVYIFTWILISLVQTLLLFYKFGFSVDISIVDSAVFNFSFAVMGLSIWFIGAYDDIKNQSVYFTVFKQMFSGLVFIVVWVLLSSWLLDWFISDMSYLEFKSETIFWRYILGSFYYVILSIVFFLILNYENMKYELEQKAIFEKMAIQSELKALKTQVNPHFLFNSLNSISYLTISDGIKAQEMLVKLSEFMRYSLRKEDSQFISLSDELRNLHSYLDIEKIRFEDKISYTQNVDKNLEHIKVPHLILQPLLENAIKYGVYESDTSVEINLEINKVDNFLKIVLKNDVQDDAHIHKGEGIGLDNISGRLNLLYNAVDLLKTEIVDAVFIATIYIPLSKME